MTVIEEMKTVYEPALALIVYKSHKNYSDSYVESRKITNGKMGAGAPLSEETITKLVNSFKPVKKEEVKKFKGGAVPEELKFFKLDETGVKEMVWYRPAQQRMMSFSESLLLDDGIASVPGLIYCVNERRLSVFAIKDKTIKPGTKLFQPPFHNCSTDGTVCLGSAKADIPNNASFLDLMEYWEKLFWGSKFSHNGSAMIDGNINLVWKDQVSNPEKPFDNKFLIKTGLTFKDLI